MATISTQHPRSDTCLFVSAIHRGVTTVGVTLGLIAAGCQAGAAPPKSADSVKEVSKLVIASPQGTARPPFKFNAEDEALLDEVQRGAFWWTWDSCDPATGLTHDRSSETFASTASIGFALAGLPGAVERGWVTRQEAQARALLILRTLDKSPRKAGLFYHYLDGTTAQIPASSPEGTVSTIDSAILLSGMLVASSYFGGEVGERADRFVAEANWRFFTDPKAKEPHWKGFVSLGWNPDDISRPTGDGKLLPYYWLDAGDEQRLVAFLAVAAPKPEHALDPKIYYQMRRHIGRDDACGEVSYIPWSGALFTSFFAQCFIPYAAMGPDNPSAFGVERRASIDWWENSRRVVHMHRARAMQLSTHMPSFGENAWGLTACDAASGYIVPGVYPKPVQYADERADWDFESAKQARRKDYGDGTIAPYGAGCSVMFEPALAIAALRHYRQVQGPNGEPLVWRGVQRRDFQKPDSIGCYGFQDSYNSRTGWVAKDCVGIDQGPLALAIENARSGLVWKLFKSHPYVKSGLTKLGLQ